MTKNEAGKRHRGKRQRFDKDVKSSLRNYNIEWANNGVYEATRKLCNVRPKRFDTIKSKRERLLTKEDKVRKRWQEHFMEVLKRLDPVMTVEIIDDAMMMMMMMLTTKRLKKDQSHLLH